MDIGAGIRHHRKLMNISQSALASKAGVDQSTISNIETGETQEPNWLLVWKIARALDVSVERLANPSARGDRETQRHLDELTSVFDALAPQFRQALLISAKSMLTAQEAVAQSGTAATNGGDQSAGGGMASIFRPPARDVSDEEWDLLPAGRI